MAKNQDLKKFCWWMTVHQKVPKSYYQSRFSWSNINKKIIFFSFKNTNLGDHFLLGTHYFLASIFELRYFLKLCPIFEKLAFIDRIFKKILEYVDSWPKVLLFRTHHLWNSTTKLILLGNAYAFLLQLQLNFFYFKASAKSDWSYGNPADVGLKAFFCH